MNYRAVVGTEWAYSNQNGDTKLVDGFEIMSQDVFLPVQVIRRGH